MPANHQYHCQYPNCPLTLGNDIQVYKELLPSLGGYLTYAGDLNRRRLEKLLSKMAENELDVLRERADVSVGCAHEEWKCCGVEQSGVVFWLCT